ncbi:class I SAM-dependent methyltransferase [Streptomyces sp. NPDC093224]|uniref:class I SAM-dependent methyltransferase n=1 Tax=Streptomyces sp. NPDC093224 TaxID=3155198 RepID=UPI0034427581
MSTPFASAAPYYARHRPPYPPEFHERLADRFALDGSQTLLDLGAGPGTACLPLAPLAEHVYAVDPEPAMLAEGRGAAAARGLTNITWLTGDDAGIGRLCLPRIDLCVIGSAFHLMDRTRVLDDLDPLLAHRAGIAIVTPLDRPGEPEPPWRAVVDEVRERFLGPGAPPGEPPAEYGETLRDLLAKSAFSRVETHVWEQPIRCTAEQLAGLQLSFPYSCPAVLGARADAFEAALRRALLEHDPGDAFERTLRVGAVFATRPRR